MKNDDMFTLYKDYSIINAKAPVLMHQPNGQFEFTDCWFMEITTGTDAETMKKIGTVCQPFSFNSAIKHVIAKGGLSFNSIERLFLLAGPDTIKNNFKVPEDFLAIALCSETPKSTTILYFEVNYIFKHSFEPDQKYRRVGTSALDELKEIYKTSELCGRSALDALKFWFKNGFSRIDEREQWVHWRQR